MPPKKKGKKAKVVPIIINGKDIAEFTRDQTETFVLGLIKNLKRARDNRNHAQLERDTVASLFHICKQEVEETCIEIHEIDTRMSTSQENYDKHLALEQQRLRYLRFANDTAVRNKRQQNIDRLEAVRLQNYNSSNEFRGQKMDLKNDLIDSMKLFELQYEKTKRIIKRDNDLRQAKNEKEMARKEAVFWEKWENQKKKLRFVWRMQIFEFNERKNMHLYRLAATQDIIHNDLKFYYNDVTMNNLGLIKALKEQIEILTKQCERSDRIYAETSAINRVLHEPLEVVKVELIDARRKNEHYIRDQNQLKRLEIMDGNLDIQMQTFYETVKKLIKDNEMLTKGYESIKRTGRITLKQIVKKINSPNRVIESKIANLKTGAEKCDVFLKEKLQECARKTELSASIDKETRAAIDKRNKLIDTLKYNLPRMVKAHDDLLITFEAKMKDFGVPDNEIELRKIISQSRIKYFGGPANLVAQNP